MEETRQHSAVDGGDRAARSRRFVVHIAVYLVATVAGLALNFVLAPDAPWSLAVLGPWGIVVAVHCARVMGLIGNR